MLLRAQQASWTQEFIQLQGMLALCNLLQLHQMKHAQQRGEKEYRVMHQVSRVARHASRSMLLPPARQALKPPLRRRLRPRALLRHSNDRAVASSTNATRAQALRCLRALMNVELGMEAMVGGAAFASLQQEMARAGSDESLDAAIPLSDVSGLSRLVACIDTNHDSVRTPRLGPAPLCTRPVCVSRAHVLHLRRWPLACISMITLLT